MCGIVGAVDRPGTDLGATLRGMADRLAHRGPDDAGFECWPAAGVGLGHRRLSIIDLSAAGHQPMASDDRAVWVVFNGEIYNYRELRKELAADGRAFRSQSDTEVIVRAYERWGLDCVARLRGMFALAIWDARLRRLLLARDRLGLKPLYYAPLAGGLAFASEPKALLAHPALGARLDPQALGDYLSYGYVPHDRCIFAGVRKLPAGHLLTREASALALSEYWAFTPMANDASAPTPAALREELTEAVRLHLIADVPVGAFLSGGVDSSVVTALMSQASATRVRTIAVAFDEGPSELPFARDVAQRWGTDHQEERVTAGGVDELLRTLVSSYDEPLADPSSVPTYLLCEAARRHVKVAVSGDGGDELFAGYGRYGRMLATRVTSAAAAGLVNGLRGLTGLARLQVFLRRMEPDPIRRYHQYVGLFDAWELAHLAGPSLAPALRGHDSLWLFRKFFRPELPLLTALQWLDLKTYLVDDILVKVDRASMAHSLEVRPPILDHEVAELALRVPASRQRDERGGKAFLKAATADLLPPSVLERGKRGFSPPTTAWFKASLWPIARQRILDGHCVRDGLIERAFVQRMVANYTERRWYKVWSLWFLEEWYRTWITGPTS
ncbi:MAG: asparagine synthase (glutamine-hydrolyzing) [Vicinamibacteria bacterium]